MGGPRVNDATCPHCGQSLKYVRLGVRVNPMMARIFDLITKRPGISSAELTDLVYGDRSKESLRPVVRSRIHEMKGLFAHTDVKIVGDSRNGYRIKEKKR